MIRTYKYRIYPNAEQQVLIAKHFGCVRWVYNWALSKRILTYEKEKKLIHRFALSSELPGLKATESTAWLSEVNAQSLCSALINLDFAYQRFFREKKGFPNFKSKASKQSFQAPQDSKVNFKTGHISVIKIKNIKAVIDREFTGKIKTVTIIKTTTGKYFASVMVDNGAPIPELKLKVGAADILGIDLGITSFATLSTGEKVPNPRHLKWALRKLRRAQRSLARKKKGSNNREKCKRRVALIHEKVANQRLDFQHKLSTRIIRENQAVALETLNVLGLLKNSKLARSIKDAGWARFVSMLEYKAKWQGKTILRIGQFEPSSKLCTCGVINQELKLSDRTWKCPGCGVAHDRDILAANNIKSIAQGMREFTPVEIGSSRSAKQELLDK